MAKKKKLTEETFILLSNGDVITDAKKLDKFVKQVITTTLGSINEWWQKETLIRDKKTKKELKNAEIAGVKNPKKPAAYLYPSLEKLGVKYEEK